jgi:hypothetical protein
MRTIPLTQGKVALVDDADFDRLDSYNWCAHKHCNTWYAVRNGRRNSRGIRPLVLMHRQLLRASSGVDIDHRDGNGLNNRRKNLRVATMCP